MNMIMIFVWLIYNSKPRYYPAKKILYDLFVEVVSFPCDNYVQIMIMYKRDCCSVQLYKHFIRTLHEKNIKNYEMFKSSIFVLL